MTFMKRWLLAVGLVGVVSLSLAVAAWQTAAALNNLRQFKFSQANRQVQRIDWIPQIASFITLRQVPSLELWRESCLTISLVNQIWQKSQELAPHYFQETVKSQHLTNEFKELLIQLSQQFKTLDTYGQQSWLANHYFQKKLAQVDTLNEGLTAILPLLNNQQTYLILLQNSEELRATGGFLGSYARLELDHGLIKNLEIEDIYVPDGQFKGFVEAPPGAYEYLSGGQGLRLPDANWHPDFPTSAQQIMDYFASINQKNFDGAVAINLPLIEQLLTVVGPVEIKDYEVTVTAQNLADVARADRQEFFPGSQQKKHFLSLLFKQLVIRAEQLETQEIKELAQLIIDGAQQKELLFFSNNPQLQNLFFKQDLAGAIKSGGELSFYLVESNVGINKANQHLARAVSLKLDQTEGELTLDFTNRNPKKVVIREAKDAARHLNYVNYQRLLVPPQIKVEQIMISDETKVEWQERFITNSLGEQFKEIGFLVVVPAEDTRQVNMKLSWPRLPAQPQILLQKQPGLPPTQYLLLYQEAEIAVELVNDQFIQL